ncbi:hypothetical protein P691DRAFT_131211 [Macrolepiota fuliginosa MF-IS2]|uniref:Uncharacterized protein n=1 Tax=Macrolepiota fuliginosa MF-IS2 TaxID=1400762 RepID=A0A9P6C0D7_9AGAR|nr:hypothetical protein P691DRAFT_131211 [Macrolepiota fuliginosa MF-IS2]
MKTRRQPAFSSSLTNQTPHPRSPTRFPPHDKSYKIRSHCNIVPTDLRVNLIYVGVSYLIRGVSFFSLSLSLVSRSSLKPQRLSDAVVLATAV